MSPVACPVPLSYRLTMSDMYAISVAKTFDIAAIAIREN